LETDPENVAFKLRSHSKPTADDFMFKPKSNQKTSPNQISRHLEAPANLISQPTPDDFLFKPEPRQQNQDFGSKPTPDDFDFIPKSPSKPTVEDFEFKKTSQVDSIVDDLDVELECEPSSSQRASRQMSIGTPITISDDEACVGSYAT
jgi:hypothetical protein